MSSLRNSLHRKNHKERSQLSHRTRLGFLEKHKDYVLRARDYHSKQERITRLRQKAADRNKDEFYFGMTRQRTERGVHVQERGNQALPTDIVKVLKSQDENYIRTMRTAGLKKIDKLKTQLSALADLVKFGTGEDEEEGLGEEDLEILREAGLLAESTTKPKKRKSVRAAPRHIVFVEDEAEAREFATRSRESQLVKDIPEAIPSEDIEESGWKISKTTKGKRRGSRNESSSVKEPGSDEERRMAAVEHRTELLKELSARLHRDKQLRYAERELEMQKLLMGKGASKKLQGSVRVDEDKDDEDEDEDDDRRPKKVDEKTWKPRVYKWRVERKR